MIGTGSTGIQAAPVIAASAKHLTVFQRTANYSVPARNAPLTAEFRRYIKEHTSDIRTHDETQRHGVQDRGAARRTPRPRSARKSTRRRGGAVGAVPGGVPGHDDRQEGERHGGRLRQAQNPLDRKGPEDRGDPVGHRSSLRRKAPADRHQLFRDLQPLQRHAGGSAQGPIDRISRAGIRTTEAEYPVDIIVSATGFDAMTGPMLRMDIRGDGWVALKDVWEAGLRNYLGLQVAGFPNRFTITGRGSPSVFATCRSRSSSTRIGSPTASGT